MKEWLSLLSANEEEARGLTLSVALEGKTLQWRRVKEKIAWELCHLHHQRLQDQSEREQHCMRSGRWVKVTVSSSSQICEPLWVFTSLG